MTDAGDSPSTPPFEASEKKHVVLPVSKWVRVFRLLAFALGCFPALFVLMSFLAQEFVLCEICSHFYWQYCVAVALSIVILLALGQRKAALFFTPVLIWCAIQLMPYYMRAPNNWEIRKESPTLSVVAFNINSKNSHYEEIANYLLSTDADVISLEEVTHEFMARITPLLLKKYPYSIAQPQEDNFGIALFSKTALDESKIEMVQPLTMQPPFPTAIARMKIGGTPTIVVAVHPPPPVSGVALLLRTKCMSEYARLARDWALDYRQNFIIMGDLNCSPWSPYFSQFLKESETRDTALGQGLQTTWPMDFWFLQTPIDHILTAPNFATISRVRGPSCGSDHHAIYAKLAVIN